MKKFIFRIQFSFEHPETGFKKTYYDVKADDLKEAMQSFNLWHGSLTNLEIIEVLKKNNPDFSEELKAEMEKAIEEEAKHFGMMIKALEEDKKQSLHDIENW